MIDQNSAIQKGRREKTKKNYAIADEARVSLDATLATLSASTQGLEAADAVERLQLHGPNQVAYEKAPPALVQFVMAFNNPFIYVLMALAVISFVTDY